MRLVIFYNFWWIFLLNYNKHNREIDANFLLDHEVYLSTIILTFYFVFPRPIVSFNSIAYYKHNSHPLSKIFK